MAGASKKRGGCWGANPKLENFENSKTVSMLFFGDFGETNSGVNWRDSGVNCRAAGVIGRDQDLGNPSIGFLSNQKTSLFCFGGIPEKTKQEFCWLG